MYWPQTSGRLRPYGKTLVSTARIHYPFAIGTAGYFAVAPGGGTEYRLSRRLMLHLDYEYQIWLNSLGYAAEPGHPLHPNGVSIGVAYRIFGFRVLLHRFPGVLFMEFSGRIPARCNHTESQ